MSSALPLPLVKISPLACLLLTPPVPPYVPILAQSRRAPRAQEWQSRSATCFNKAFSLKGEVDDSDEEEEESSSEGLEAEDWAQGVVEASGGFGGYSVQEEAQFPTLHFLEGGEDSDSDSDEEEDDEEEDEEDEDEEDDEDGDEVPVPSFGEAMAYFAMVKRYLTSFPIDDRVQSHILHLEHDLVHVTRKNHARQAGVRGLGHQS